MMHLDPASPARSGPRSCPTRAAGCPTCSTKKAMGNTSYSTRSLPCGRGGGGGGCCVWVGGGGGSGGGLSLRRCQCSGRKECGPLLVGGSLASGSPAADTASRQLGDAGWRVHGGSVSGWRKLRDRTSKLAPPGDSSCRPGSRRCRRTAGCDAPAVHGPGRQAGAWGGPGWRLKGAVSLGLRVPMQPVHCVASSACQPRSSCMSSVGSPGAHVCHHGADVAQRVGLALVVGARLALLHIPGEGGGWGVCRCV